MGELQHQYHDEVFEILKKIVSDILRIPVEEIAAESRLSDLTLVESIKLLRIAGKI
jgi:acyl carrier protein